MITRGSACDDGNLYGTNDDSTDSRSMGNDDGAATHRPGDCGQGRRSRARAEGSSGRRRLRHTAAEEGLLGLLRRWSGFTKGGGSGGRGHEQRRLGVFGWWSSRWLLGQQGLGWPEKRRFWSSSDLNDGAGGGSGRGGDGRRSEMEGWIWLLVGGQRRSSGRGLWSAPRSSEVRLEAVELGTELVGVGEEVVAATEFGRRCSGRLGSEALGSGRGLSKRVLEAEEG